MTKEPNLKDIERRAYMSHHQDGLLDLFAGVYILGFGLGVLVDRLWGIDVGAIMPAIFVAVLLPIWITAKRKITMPRIGFVKFGHQRGLKNMAVFLGLMLAGIGVFLTFTLFQSGRPPWLDILFQYGLLVFGIGTLSICALLGYMLGLNRLYAYGLLALSVLAVGHFMGIFFAYLLIVLGIAVTVAGIGLLISFVNKYPVQGDKAIAN